MSNETGIEELLDDYEVEYTTARTHPSSQDSQRRYAESRAVILSAVAEKDKRIADLEAEVRRLQNAANATTRSDGRP